MAPIGILKMWPRLDPRTGIAVFAVWAIWLSVSLIGPGEAFPSSPIYSELVKAGIAEHAFGYAVLSTALLLLAALLDRASLTYRLIVGWLCGTFWLVVGGAFLMGGWREGGFIASAGAFAFCGGLGCITTIHQWIVQP